MAHAKSEFELKLVGAPRDLAAATEFALVDQHAAGPPSWERLVSTYYDSADQKLAAAGVSLRIRDEAGARTLTAKQTPRGAGAVVRLETERPIEEGDPDFRTGVSEIDAVIAAAGDLAPIARTVTDRWSRLIDCGGALIEFSAEFGSAENLADKRSAPLAEIELELLKGPADALFEAARRLVSDAGGRLRLSLETKREAALRGGGAAVPSKRDRPSLAPDASAADILAAALQQAATQIIEASEAFVARRDSDAARLLRVGLRRLRAAEQVFRRDIPADEFAPLALFARDLGRRIGAARDIDVFIRRNLNEAPPSAELRAHLEAKRAQMFADVASALSGPAFGSFSIDLLSAAYLQKWRTANSAQLAAPARSYAENALDRRWRRMTGRAQVIDFSAVASLHILRVDLKKLRYAAQFFRGQFDAASRKPFFAAMSALQEAFGDINDAVVAQEIASSVYIGHGAKAAHVAGFIAGRRSAEAAAAARIAEENWRRFVDMPPFWRPAPDADVRASLPDLESGRSR